MHNFVKLTLKGLSKSSLWSIALLKSNWTVIRQLIYGKVQSASRLTMLKCSPQPYLLKSSSSTTQSNLNLLNKYLEVENMTMSQLIWFCLTSSSDVKDIFSTSRTRAWHQRQCCFWCKAQVLDIKQISLKTWAWCEVKPDELAQYVHSFEKAGWQMPLTDMSMHLGGWPHAWGQMQRRQPRQQQHPARTSSFSKWRHITSVLNLLRKNGKYISFLKANDSRCRIGS